MKAAKAAGEFFAHPIIQVALVLGVSTVVLAYFSKRVFDEPLKNWQLSLPALLGMFLQGLAQNRRFSRFNRPWMRMTVIVLATIAIIAINL